MRSTFLGLETARRGMFTQQSALYTTGHNISNANTPGYSRQQVNFQTTSPYPAAGLNRPQIPGQMGTGVQASTIERIRDVFVDTQYRMENNKLGHFSTLNQALSKMEDIMNEPTDSGLHSVLEKFWNSLQDLAAHTENTGARDIVASNGQMVADTLNYYYNSLTRVQNDLSNEIIVKEREINKLTEQINALNEQIGQIEPQGYLPNDLYDQRDLLVDQLSSLVNIKVTTQKPDNYGNAKPTAVGKYMIELVKKDSNSFEPPLFLIDKKGANAIKVLDDNRQTAEGENADALVGPVTAIQIGGGSPIPVDKLVGSLSGSLPALIESFGYDDGTGAKGYYPEMIKKLNQMTKAFIDEFNYIHRQGYALGETDETSKVERDFFVFDDPANPAQTIRVADEIIDDPTKIAAGLNSGDAGDNANAQRLAEIKSKNFNEYEVYLAGEAVRPEGLSGNMNTFYAGIIGKLGVDAQGVRKDASNTQVLLDAVDYNRQSISAVSLDEELTNMIKFQHAYNAGARNITVIDEMLDRIINGMGVVGR